MPRAPLQILVLPFREVRKSEFEYAVLRRSDDGYWQGVALKELHERLQNNQLDSGKIEE